MTVYSYVLSIATLYSTTGVILSKRDFREADRLYSVLTPTHGKVELLARGGHKPLAKLTPHLEMAAEVELLIVEGRAYQTVAGVERRRSLLDARAGLCERLLVANSLALLDLAIRPGERDSALYEFAVSWLAFAGACGDLTDERSAFLLSSFVLKLLSLCGYAPELRVCLACRQDVTPDALRWQAQKGGVVCARCSNGQEGQWFHARPLDSAVLKLLRFAIMEPFPAQFRPTLAPSDTQQFHDTLESYLVTHFPVIPAVSIRGACATQ